MYIKSITIDGFKTYGKRTEINGLDQSFNAITGLNGSGKSNLLDSICFVLGLANPSLARVAHLRELIYKNGQTGLTKASVSITFNNSNKRQSPPGYENYDEVTIRREVTMENRTRYFINGFTAQNNQVLDLFQSVSLNISNPHFLIMQGRITKVLNMKPNEILSMVEEATGLSLYESKKKTTQSTLVKKDLALNSIDILINETILTKLEQLTKEQSSLLAYQKVCIDMENLKKIHTAWTFTNLVSLSQQTDARIKDQQNKISEAEEKIETINESVDQIQEQIKQSQKDSVFRPKLAALEDQLKEVQMEETKVLSEMNLKKDNLNEVLKTKSNLVKQIKEESKVKSAKEKEYEKLNQAFSQFEEARRQDEAELEKASKDLEVIASGASRGDDGEAAATLADQMMQTKREIANLDTETAKAKMKVQHCKAELVKKESEASKKKGNYDNDLKLVERMESEVSKLKNDLEATGFDEASSESMLVERETLRKEYDQLRYDVNSLENKLPQIHFNYRKPTPDFDSSRVKGAVCTLFKVKDPRDYTALEVAAGGRLYNIIVSDEETAKLILEKGRPEKRCTLLPLDKIRGRDVDPRALKNAQSIVGRDNVFPALDLIDFDPSLTEAMKYVFGDTLICTNMECAKKVTFAKNVQLRTVTLDGEVFDPSGTLTGGAIGGKGAVLSAIDQLMKKRSSLGKVKSRLMEIEKKLDSMHSSKQQFAQLKQQYDLRYHEIELLRERLKTTNQHLLLEEIENLKATIEENETSLQEMVNQKKSAEKKVKELEHKMKNTASIREKELAEAEKALEKAKKNFEKSKKAASEREQSVSFLKMEIDELKKSLDNYTGQLAEVDARIETHQAQVDEAGKAVEGAKDKVSTVQEEMKKLKRLINEHSSEIARLNKQKENLIREAEEMKLSIKKYQHEITQIESEGKDAGKGIQQLMKKFPWINEEKHLFGEESAGYGFKRADFNPVELDDRIKRLTDEKNKLSKTVNMRANVMLGDKEKEAEELNKKRQIIENDKKKLLGYMEDVDKKKKDALQDAWEKINVDFGNIFSTLLPGANAKLMPPEGKTIMEGLEVKVAFGDVWKESLTELSGGQRSLVALSLILALLLYNPAPIYILDEVDAALDQSHTTNIGTMIKKHFTNSQFIIVSLKDDMFNNANVLFRTKFIDGCSTVTRFAKGDR